MDVPAWLKVPTEEPSIVFPIGAIIEDEKGIYKIIDFQKQDKVLHKYKVEVLTLKQQIPIHLRPFLDDKIQWLLVLPQNLHAIKRIA